jgi:YD repeat-containing protein
MNKAELEQEKQKTTKRDKIVTAISCILVLALAIYVCIVTCRGYNDEGKLVMDMCYDSDGGLDNIVIYKYDEQGNCISGTVYEGITKICEIEDYESSIQEYYYTDSFIDYASICECEYEYDENGNILKGNYYLYDTIRLEQEYDSFGNIVKAIYYDKTGYVDAIYEYEYNKQGQLARKLKTYRSDWVYKYKYDSFGNLIRYTEYYNEDGSNPYQSEKKIYVYNNIVKQLYYAGYNVLSDIDYLIRCKVDFSNSENITEQIIFNNVETVWEKWHSNDSGYGYSR